MKAFDTKIFLFSIFFFIPIILLFEDFLVGNLINQILLFSIPLLWPGLAHGSLDVIIAKKNKIIKNKKDEFFFLFVYILIPVIFFTFWIYFPNILFISFIFLSLFHFGVSDCVTSKNESRWIEIIIRGMIVIVFPFKFYSAESIEIFSFFLLSKDFLISLQIYFNFLFVLIFFLISIWIIKNIYLIKNNLNSKIFLIELIALIFCFWFYEPLISFFIYFCFLHSTRHLIEEKKNLDINNFQLILKTIPMTFLTFTFFIFIFIFFENQFNENINYVVIGLSSLTVSHVLLVSFTKLYHR